MCSERPWPAEQFCQFQGKVVTPSLEFLKESVCNCVLDNNHWVNLAGQANVMSCPPAGKRICTSFRAFVGNLLNDMTF